MISPDNKFYITRQQRDLRSWENRNSDFTRSIDLPRTPTNNTTLLPYIQNGVKDIPGAVEVQGVSIGFDIKLRVTGFDNDSFTLNVLFDNQRLFSRIKGKIADVV